MGIDPQLWLLAGAVFLLASVVKGMVGMGLPTIAMGLLSLVLPPAEAAALLIVPSLVTNLWQLFTGHQRQREVTVLAGGRARDRAAG